ncbi:hypothetical protein KsCSTR_40410 [Candidatus Kuenenia stuttgartiensis]|uniref:Uncharacterized protein n=1 Tax=Kuenenia stuttgartiensis TaxID=174633 RepID=Q1Q7M7_KUEST|nr:hypothetical protein [Candidatus Kuenenia stuttgartiensis]QII13420.1 hypothetical protein KsCSTR_40410 [Candidatus Kuenenia stuttgartiensis]CAJ70830.1 hypothetical protein kusta0085 [Candidatus Kuenenia stuttgartiensis]
MEGEKALRSKILLMCIFSIAIFSLSEDRFCLCAEENTQVEGEKEEKSELAKLMKEIDKNYKATEEISGYYNYKEKEWKIIGDASVNLINLCKIALKKFARPDDEKYQKLNRMMLEESEKMHEVYERRGQVGALEDAQWQVRRLRQTCALCHKHLGIHLYPNLYPGHKDWGVK